MPSLASQHFDPAVKMLLIGHSKTRKTSSLSSLVKAGFKLVIADFDGNVDFLYHDLMATDPKLLENVIVEQFRDLTKLVNGNPVCDGKPEAYEKFMRLLDEGVGADGQPVVWGGRPIGPVKLLDRSWVVVVDSLWAAARNAFLMHAKLCPTKDPRQTYGGAGGIILTLLDGIKDPGFKPHCIIISHMTLVEANEGSRYFPSSIGQKSPQDVPKLFPRLLVARRKGQGTNAKYVISTVSTDDIDAGSALPEGKVPADLPNETALATYFAACGATPNA